VVVACDRRVCEQFSIFVPLVEGSEQGSVGDAVVAYANRFAWQGLISTYAVGSGLSGGLGAGIGFSIQCNSKVLFSFGAGVGGGISASG
jgi:hypothetical protein